MRKFLVSYGVRQGRGVFNETTEEVEFNCEDSLSGGNLAKYILDHLPLKYTSYTYQIVLYNFWEIIEQENKDEAD